MLKIPLAITAIFALSTLTAGQSLPNKPTRKTMTLPEAIESVRPSIVQILIRVQPPPQAGVGGIQLPQRPQEAVLGTGFFINADGYAITARHVVELFRNIQAPNGGTKILMVGLAGPNIDSSKIKIVGSFGLTQCEVIAEDERHDLALVKLKQNPFKGEMGNFMKAGEKVISWLHGVPTLSPSRPQDGEAIAISGYPFSSPVLVTSSGNLASSWSYETEEVHVPGAPTWFTELDTADSYLADVHVNPGNSGGPVYNVKQGFVIGVCVSFQMAPVLYADGNHEPASSGGRPLASNSALSNVVPTRYVIDLLKKNNLKWEQAK